jgi:hypothetical protein
VVYSLVPSLAVGFEDLKRRIQEQDKASKAFNTSLDVSIILHNLNGNILNDVLLIDGFPCILTFFFIYLF